MSVVVVFTGGTISMTADPVAGGNVPALDGAAILARTRGLDEIAEVRAIDYGLVPASHFRFPQLFEIAGLHRSALAARDVDGAVVVQGTDTIEETAFFYDLVVGGPKPVVVTGAMRAASDDGYDGPANLRDAVRVAASPLFRDAGCVVVATGAIDAADDVTKTHATAPTTFRSLNLGPLGEVSQGRVILGRPRGPRRVVPGAAVAAEPVPLITATVSMDAGILAACVAAGARGVVVEATGSGNTSAELLAEAATAIEAGVPVVEATRCPSGRVGTAYAFPGAGARWVAAGALQAGYLTGPKARVALAVGRGAGLTMDGLRELFADPS
jgi:L-asparaginase